MIFCDLCDLIDDRSETSKFPLSFSFLNEPPLRVFPVLYEQRGENDLEIIHGNTSKSSFILCQGAHHLKIDQKDCKKREILIDQKAQSSDLTGSKDQIFQRSHHFVGPSTLPMLLLAHNHHNRTLGQRCRDNLLMNHLWKYY